MYLLYYQLLSEGSISYYGHYYYLCRHKHNYYVLVILKETVVCVGEMSE